MNENERPWGRYEVLVDEDYCKVKRIFVNPGHRLSYQYHENRSEVWSVVKGSGKAVLDGEEKEVHPGTVIMIPTGGKHRIGNDSDEELIFIEVQHGTYFGEDDIVRIEDDYKRG
jgi:mannose-6-phosphate isomerase